jgi:hypothetical protein
MCPAQNKKNKFHGYISIVFFFISIIIGIISIVPYSLHAALLNALTVFIMIFSVSFYYCSKCPTRELCNHWLFGKVSKLVSKYKPENYNTFDLLFGTILPLAIVVLMPQFWLLKSPVLLLLYWSFMALAVVDVVFFVCTKCENQKCGMCRNKLRNIQNF